jgi:hypothetical protein
LAAIGEVMSAGAYRLGSFTPSSRPSLQVIMSGLRASTTEMVASYILVCYCANALPVLGVGVLSHFVGSVKADITFACVITALAALALATTASRLARPAHPLS